MNLNLHCCWRENWKAEGHPRYLRDFLQLSAGCSPRGQNEKLVGEGHKSRKQRPGLVFNNSPPRPPTVHVAAGSFTVGDVLIAQRNICRLCVMLRKSYFCRIIIQCHKYTRRHWKIKTRKMKYTIRKQVDVSQRKGRYKNFFLTLSLCGGVYCGSWQWNRAHFSPQLYAYKYLKYLFGHCLTRNGVCSAQSPVCCRSSSSGRRTRADAPRAGSSSSGPCWWPRALPSVLWHPLFRLGSFYLCLNVFLCSAACLLWWVKGKLTSQICAHPAVLKCSHLKERDEKRVPNLYFCMGE